MQMGLPAPPNVSGRRCAAWVHSWGGGRTSLPFFIGARRRSRPRNLWGESPHFLRARFLGRGGARHMDAARGMDGGEEGELASFLYGRPWAVGCQGGGGGADGAAEAPSASVPPHAPAAAAWWI